MYRVERTADMMLNRERNGRSWMERFISNTCPFDDMGYAVLGTFDVLALCPDRNIALAIKEALEKADQASASKFKVKTYAETCGGCPTIYQGYTENDQHFYIRYRHGNFRVEINGNTVFADYHGRQADGIASLEEVQEWSKSVLDWSGATYKEWEKDW